ncbi:hypothetical protein ABWW58_10550 [Sporolactobacillus sp. STCC-11]|uniref:hypothetical protein n=1 Tax=Sporolactobacillus caesalpiniae TaxID=3230362 RepID=UPI003399AA48
MAYLLLPISLFIKTFNISTTLYYVVQLPVYLYSLIAVYAFFSQSKNNYRRLMKDSFNKRVISCLLITLGLQIVALSWSYFSLIGNDFNRNPINEFVKLIIVILCIISHYCVVKFVVSDEKSIMKFLQGTGIALVILLVISYIQFLYLLFPNIFSKAVEILGSFEYRYKRDWYSAGSYVQTESRINGLNPESDYLAVQYLVIFVPFILASIKNKFNFFSEKIKYHPSLYYLLLVSIIVILFFAKTSTGILAIGMIMFSLWLIVPLREKIIFAVLISIALVTIYIAAIHSPMIMEILNITLFTKLGGDSMLNRTGGTLGLIFTWLRHPIFGVGFNYHDYYLFKFVPKWTMTSYEFRSVFAPERTYPILSAIFGWLAEFGAIFVAFISVYVYRLLKDFRRISNFVQSVNISEREKQMINALKDSVYYFFFFYLICSLLIFNWYESIYMITLFFFVVVRQYLKKRFNIEESYR